MATMNVSLPDQMKDWVEARTSDGTFSNSSDYVRHLIRQDQERQAALRELQAEVTKGLESGPPRPFEVDAFLERMHQKYGG